MEILRYIIVFFTVGAGGSVIGAILFLLLFPFASRLRGTNAGRAIAAVSNGIGMLLAVFLAYLACEWTGSHAKYLMFVITFCAMVSNNLWRVKRAKGAYSMGGQILNEDPELRSGWVLTEQMNMLADVVGFAGGMALIPKLVFI